MGNLLRTPIHLQPPSGDDSPLAELPPEIFLMVARRMDNDGRRNLTQTCSRFRQILTDPRIQTDVEYDTRKTFDSLQLLCTVQPGGSFVIGISEPPPPPVYNRRFLLFPEHAYRSPETVHTQFPSIRNVCMHNTFDIWEHFEKMSAAINVKKIALLFQSYHTEFVVDVASAVADLFMDQEGLRSDVCKEMEVVLHRPIPKELQGPQWQENSMHLLMHSVSIEYELKAFFRRQQFEQLETTMKIYEEMDFITVKVIEGS